MSPDFGSRSDSARAGTEVAARVADVLIVLGAQAGHGGVSDIARSLGLSKTVVYRILRSLESRDLVYYDPDRHGYSLGAAAFALGQGAPYRSTLHRASRRTLKALTDATGESAFIAGRVGARFIYVDHATGSQGFEINSPGSGETLPLYAGAAGKAILANAGVRVRNSVLNAERPRLTRHTITDENMLVQHLHQISRNGVAVSVGERREGVVGVSSAIFDSFNNAIGSLCVYGPVARFGDTMIPRIANIVRSASASITRAVRD